MPFLIHGKGGGRALGSRFPVPRFTVSPFRLPPPLVRTSKGGEGPSLAWPLSRTAFMRLRQKVYVHAFILFD